MVDELLDAPPGTPQPIDLESFWSRAVALAQEVDPRLRVTVLETVDETACVDPELGVSGGAFLLLVAKSRMGRRPVRVVHRAASGLTSTLVDIPREPRPRGTADGPAPVAGALVRDPEWWIARRRLGRAGVVVHPGPGGWTELRWQQPTC